jgi:PAS domain-containing protein
VPESRQDLRDGRRRGRVERGAAGSYTAKSVERVPDALRSRGFSAEGDRFVFDKELRRSVIFGRHDLIQDAPISRVNLLMCRNTLMYFNTEAQGRILARFHFGLGDSGVLFLGRAEMLLTHGHLFTPLELKRRVFRRVSKDNWRERMAIMTLANAEETLEAADHQSVFPAAFDASPHAQFVIDSNGFLALFNERARSLFGLAPSDLGKPIQDLDLSYRPVELRSRIACERSISAGPSRFGRPCGSHRARHEVLDTRRAPLRIGWPAHRRERVVRWTSRGFRTCKFSSVVPNTTSRRHTKSSSQPTKSSKPRTRSCSRQVEELETTNEELHRQTRNWRP